jgi:hypothetical protein
VEFRKGGPIFEMAKARLGPIHATAGSFHVTQIVLCVVPGPLHQRITVRLSQASQARDFCQS